MSEMINIGVCDVFFTPPGSSNEVYIGLTKGGVEFSYDVKWHEVKVDQYGDTPIDQTLEGETCQAKVPVVETDLENIKSLMPTGKAILDGANLKQVGFGSLPGMKMSKKAGKLRLHPTSYGTDTSNDVVIWKAANIGGVKLGYKFNDEQVIEASFVGLVDTTKSVGMMLFMIGDSAYTAPDEDRVLTSFYLSPNNPDIGRGDTLQFKANAVFEGGIYEDITDMVTWATSDELSVTITTVGLATAVKSSGSCTISATYNGQTASTSVNLTV